jgi:hypothetical protein
LLTNGDIEFPPRDVKTILRENWSYLIRIASEGKRP